MRGGRGHRIFSGFKSRSPADHETRNTCAQYPTTSDEHVQQSQRGGANATLHIGVSCSVERGGVTHQVTEGDTTPVDRTRRRCGRASGHQLCLELIPFRLYSWRCARSQRLNWNGCLGELFISCRQSNVPPLGRSCCDGGFGSDRSNSGYLSSP